MPKKRALSDKQVLKVFKMSASGKYTQQQIADRFGVSRALISCTLSGKRNSKTVIPEGNFKTFKVDGARYAIYDDGRIFSIGNVKFLKPDEANGYHRVSLGPQEKKRYVHRLVLTHFVGKPKDGQQACHKNGKRTDNRLKNLRWDTAKGNNADKHKHKTALVGNKNHKVVVPDKLVSHLLFAYKHSELSAWDFAEDMGERLDMNAHTIYSVLKRKHFNDGVLDDWNS